SLRWEAATGAWRYTVDNGSAGVQGLKAGQQFSDSRTVTSEDGTASQAIVVTITGANDAATISGTATGAVTEDATPNAASGALTVSDADSGEAVFQAASGLQGAYGSFTFDAATGAWTYTLDNGSAAVQGLKAGQQVSDSLTVTSQDGTASQSTEGRRVGAEGGAPISGAHTEGRTEDATRNAASGGLTVGDAGSGEAVFQAASGLQGAYGSFTFDAATGAWTYTLDNGSAAVQGLKAGQQVSDSLTVTSQDGTASQ